MSSTKSGSSNQKAPASANAWRRLDADVDAVTLIGVGHDDEVFAELLAHGADDTNVLIEIEADFDFYAVKPLLGEPTRPAGNFRRLFGIERGGIYRDFVAHFAAEQLIERHAARLAENIPKRDVDAAQGDDADASGAELLMAAADISGVPNLIDVRRIHADQQRLEHPGDDEFNQFAVARSRAETVDAVIGLHLDQRRRARVSHSGTAEDLPRRRYFRAQPDGFYIGDFHLSPKIFVILVIVPVIVIRADRIDDQQLVAFDQLRRVGQHIFAHGDAAQPFEHSLAFHRETIVDK